jgi:hypothetical protein
MAQKSPVKNQQQHCRSHHRAQEDEPGKSHTALDSILVDYGCRRAGTDLILARNAKLDQYRRATSVGNTARDHLS